jgi:hypothetical protein
MATPTNWDRGSVNDWIVEATHEGLWPGDPLVDILIVKAQELGLEPADLRQFIYECLGSTELRYAIYAEQLARWAAPALNPDQSKCGHCGDPVDDPATHVCATKEKQA